MSIPTRLAARLARRTVFVSALGLALAASATAQAPAPERPKVLVEAEEMELALEAAPEALRAKAGVWILTDKGYREKRKTSNGYTCIVNRDDPGSIKPTCYDREGTETILPTVVWFGDQLMLGRPVKDVKADLAAGFASGRFRAPNRAGIAFMMSPRIVNAMTMPNGERMRGTAPPHYMIYAPNLTNADLDLPSDLYNIYPWLPYVAYQGPHGFLIITVEPPSSP